MVEGMDHRRVLRVEGVAETEILTLVPPAGLAVEKEKAVVKVAIERESIRRF